MAAPLRRETTDEAFLREQYGDVDTYTKPIDQTRFGVQNAQIERRRGTPAPPANTNRAPSTAAATRAATTTTIPRYTNRTTTIPRAQRKGKKKGVVKKLTEKVRTTLAYARAVPGVGSALVWTFWIWLIQAFLASFTLLALGLAFYLESILNQYANIPIVSQILLAALEAIGVDLEMFMALFFIGTGLVMLTVLFQLVLAYVQLKFFLLNPVLGKRGKISKFGFFMLALVGMIIPGINMLPLVQLWLIFVALNPK